MVGRCTQRGSIPNISEHYRDRVLMRALSLSSQAMPRSQAGPRAGVWLTAIPCKPATTMPPQAMQIALRRRLRLPVPLGPDCCGPNPGCGGTPSLAPEQASWPDAPAWWSELGVQVPCSSPRGSSHGRGARRARRRTKSRMKRCAPALHRPPTSSNFCGPPRGSWGCGMRLRCSATCKAAPSTSAVHGWGRPILVKGNTRAASQQRAPLYHKIKAPAIEVNYCCGPTWPSLRLLRGRNGAPGRLPPNQGRATAPPWSVFSTSWHPRGPAVSLCGHKPRPRAAAAEISRSSGFRGLRTHFRAGIKIHRKKSGLGLRDFESGMSIP